MLSRDIWVYADYTDGKLHNVTGELLGTAVSLATENGGTVCAVVVGSEVKKYTDELIYWGADRVYLVEDQLFENYNNELYTKVLQKLAEKYDPEIILFGSVFDRRDLAPRLAARLGTGIISECNDLYYDEDKTLTAEKISFGGRFSGKVVFADGTRPYIVTARPGVLRGSRDVNRTGEVIMEVPDAGPQDMMTQIRSVAQAAKKVVALSDADIVVSGGKGAGGPEGFKLIQALADKLNGVVGASRMAVDLGWIGYEHQVGQAGATVKPKIYIACGISGASQHIVGMWESDIVIAINTHRYAAIFNFADYGIVGDMFEVIPKLIEELDK
ncbi:MAG: electron transfer flavoprotein subunit alpha/FixB family protein [Firmicutes bacterium]|nr:electron transfer flavoprotein subunit alpha/FixB family protein [Bacillota bacterium]